MCEIFVKGIFGLKTMESGLEGVEKGSLNMMVVKVKLLAIIRLGQTKRSNGTVTRLVAESTQIRVSNSRLIRGSGLTKIGEVLS